MYNYYFPYSPFYQTQTPYINHCPLYIYNIYPTESPKSTPQINQSSTIVQSNQKEQIKPKKPINRRNILPNITRKIVSYIATQKYSKEVIQKNFPNINELDLLKFYQYVHRLKEQLNDYISKDDLYKFWLGKTKSGSLKLHDHQNFQKIIRILSKRFLDSHARNWILLSKKMKKQLKYEHLKYCRKIRKMLTSKQLL